MDALIIMVRNAELGKVKTRLAAGVGEEEALRIYQILLARTRVAALSLPVHRLLFYSDRIEHNDLWFNHLFDKHLQQGADLGARMAAAFETAFAKGARRAVIIGSDCPELDGAMLHRAYQALHRRAFVLGPVEDGGYYLLGMKQPTPALFTDMAWSTSSVLQTTTARIEALGKTYRLLPTLLDIDTRADWEQWQRRS